MGGVVEKIGNGHWPAAFHELLAPGQVLGSWRRNLDIGPSARLHACAHLREHGGGVSEVLEYMRGKHRIEESVLETERLGIEIGKLLALVAVEVLSALPVDREEADIRPLWR